MVASKLKREVSEWFAYPPRGRGRLVEGVIIALIIIISALPVALAYTTSETARRVIKIVEVVITSIFLVEYLLRLWVAEDKLRHVVQPYSIVDLIAILPLVIPGTYFQLIRVFRLLRLLRLVRYLRGTHFFFGATSLKNLIILRILFTIVAIIFVASGLVYYAEHGAPGSTFKSFADAVYFSIVTMATVGYGDITPQTDYGRWMTVMIIFSGIVLLPWQIKDLIEQVVISRTKRELACPSCSLSPHEPDALYCRRCGAALPPPARGDKAVTRTRGEQSKPSRSA
jgi:voltage-gated potassium channel